MNIKTFLIVVAAIAMLCAITMIPSKAQSVPEPITEAKPTLTHAQTVWKYALEWCESNGVKTAVNPNDLDNTPSYYSYQFKPSTFRYYGEKYGVIEKGHTDAEIMELMKQYELQDAIVTQMILHRSEINWSQQFPWCVKKLGTPPLPYPTPNPSPTAK